MPGSEALRRWTRVRRLGIGVTAAACLIVACGIARAAGRPARGEDGWVRYSVPGTQMPLTLRWQLLRIDGDQLVIRIESYLDGQLRATREVTRARLRVPDQYRRETIVAGGTKYDCKVFQVGSTTYWYSEDVPVVGVVRSRNGEHDIMELLDSSARHPR